MHSKHRHPLAGKWRKFLNKTIFGLPLLTWLVLLFSLWLFVVILGTKLSGLWKLVLVVVEMLFVSKYLEVKHHFEAYYSMVLVRSKKGLNIIRSLAHSLGNYLDVLADVYFALAFGLLSLWLMDWQPLSKRIFSLILSWILLFSLALLYPFATSYISAFLPAPSHAVYTANTSLVSSLILFLGGFVSLLSFFTYASAISILHQLYIHFFVSSVAVKEAVTLVLPGITIPLFEGLLALIIVLVVHEGGHALLTVRERVPLLSSGLVLFGSIPIGAFVEPDEKRLFSKSRRSVARVLSSGPGFNFLTTVVFGILFLAFLTYSTPYTSNGCYVVGGALPKGTIITGFANSSCYTTLPANASVNVELANGTTLAMKTNEEGKLNVLVYPIGKTSGLHYYKIGWLEFLYNFLGLTFALNLFVGLVNLIPIPLFDGDHLLRSVVKSDFLYNAVRYSLLLAFLILLLPSLL